MLCYFEETMRTKSRISVKDICFSWPIISWYRKYFIPMDFLCFRTVLKLLAELASLSKTVLCLMYIVLNTVQYTVLIVLFILLYTKLDSLYRKVNLQWSVQLSREDSLVLVSFARSQNQFNSVVSRGEFTKTNIFTKPCFQCICWSPKRIF